LRCKICDVGRQARDSQFYRVMCSNGRQLDLEILKRLADEVSSFRPLIAVTSTEPLLFDDLFEFARHVRSLGMSFQLTTNGLLLPSKAHEVVSSGIDHLWVSLDGPAEIHNRIRSNTASYQAAVEGINQVGLLAKEQEKKLGININCTISNFNYACVTSFLEELRRLPLDCVVISHMNYVTPLMAERHNESHGDFCEATASCIPEGPVDVDILWSQLREIKKNRYPFKVEFEPDLDYQGIVDFYRNPHVIVYRKECLAPWNCAQLSSNGDWVITTRCFHKVVGNVFEESFIQTWRGAKYREFRKWLARVRLTPACTRCCGVL
jgi:Fe-coproporphyrin III synthase